MSYCRFSSLDFACDLYVYASADGFVVDVAANRIVGPVPPLYRPTSDGEAEMRKANAAYQAQIAYLEEAQRLPIDLPHAGETFTCADAGIALETLRRLRMIGYVFPDHVLEDLQTEMEDPDEAA